MSSRSRIARSLGEATAGATQQGTAASFSPPPCFYWRWCAQRTALLECGRSVCARCAETLRGTEYPLRDPSADRRNLLRHYALRHEAQLAAAQLDSPE